jgi:enoyl-CoA hydratase
MSDAVTTTIDGDVAVIRFDDGKANALSFEALDALSAALEAGTSSKAIVMVGREGKFSAGFDLSIMTGDSAEAAGNLLKRGALLGLQVFESPVPVVFGVTGHALAMGGILLTCADYRVGADGPYKLGLNEVAIGMAVPTFAIELCRDRLVKSWFTRCVQHAHICSPADALAASFLDEVVPLDQVEARAIEVAQQLADTVQQPAFSVTRQLVRGDMAEELRQGVERDLALFDIKP